MSTLGAVSATGLTVGRGGTESGAGSLGSATNRKMRDDAPNRKKCHILRMEACCSAFFDNSDAVMDRDMAFLASNDASRAMRGGRETTEYTEQRTSGHTRSGLLECVLAVPLAFVCFAYFVVTLSLGPTQLIAKRKPILFW